jgi:hypothetical protein
VAGHAILTSDEARQIAAQTAASDGEIARSTQSVPATTTMLPSNASGDHYGAQHDEDGYVHAASKYAASMCDTPQALHSKV